jgi:hypothetical protein
LPIALPRPRQGTIPRFGVSPRRHIGPAGALTADQVISDLDQTLLAEWLVTGPTIADGFPIGMTLTGLGGNKLTLAAP